MESKQEKLARLQAEVAAEEAALRQQKIDKERAARIAATEAKQLAAQKQRDATILSNITETRDAIVKAVGEHATEPAFLLDLVCMLIIKTDHSNQSLRDYISALGRKYNK